MNRNVGTIGFTLTLALLILSAWLSYRNTRQLVVSAIPDRAFRPMIGNDCPSRSSPPDRMGRGWVWPSAGNSSSSTAARSSWSPEGLGQPSGWPSLRPAEDRSTEKDGGYPHMGEIPPWGGASTHVVETHRRVRHRTQQFTQLSVVQRVERPTNRMPPSRTRLATPKRSR
jgi:hypothetical protein